MGPITVCIKSIDRTEGSQSNFNVKFGHVLPNTGTVFKCVVSNFFARGSEKFIRVPGVGVARAYALVADFPFINYYSTNTRPIALTSVRTWEIVGSFEFLMGNINHQEINIKYMSFRNTQASFVEYENNAIIIITAEDTE